ncbi:hypothetical protein SCHPADRAFT_894560 [Schizopora paradoxa]|uniref:Uncharacterized protein n=1 Tax=Schizopora paradoxa TaxID=27342 RepID=A0A0H2RDH5_9AGAM|nr:hypothetical protein SCHPADRAFT_894560 [Schizopora paradoxa]
MDPSQQARRSDAANQLPPPSYEKEEPRHELDSLFNYSFSPRGIKQLEHHLETFALRPEEKRVCKDFLDAAYRAFFVAGNHNDGKHEMYGTVRHENQICFESAGKTADALSARKVEKEAYANLLHDLMVTRDRVFDTATFSVTIDGHQHHCVLGNEDPKNILADVYVPSHLLMRYPEIRRPIAKAIQEVISSLGVAEVKFVKDKDRRNGVTYGSSSLCDSDNSPPEEHGDRPLIPPPAPNTSRYSVWGYSAAANPFVADAAYEPSPTMSYTGEHTLRSRSQLEGLLTSSNNKIRRLRAEIGPLTDEKDAAQWALKEALGREEQYKDMEMSFMMEEDSKEKEILRLKGEILDLKATAFPSLLPIPYALRTPSTPPQGGSASTSAASGGNEARGFGVKSHIVIRNKQLPLDTHQTLHFIARKHDRPEWEGAIAHFVNVRVAKDLSDAMIEDDDAAVELYRERAAAVRAAAAFVRN